jgi:protoheme IX farnesyltransferase
MFALIFLWTPPHSWALALFVKTDYANAGVPMMPVVAGEASTRRQLFAYSIPMAAAALAPWLLDYASRAYGIAAMALTFAFLVLAFGVAQRLPADGDAMKAERRLFWYSIFYLFIIFGALAADRMVHA